jgi:hypothetical protein
MLAWRKKKAIAKQEDNVRRSLAKFVKVGRDIDTKIFASGRSQPRDTMRGQQLQSELARSVIGPLPLSEIKRRFFDPILSDPDTTKGVKMGIQFVCDQAR